MMKFSTLMLLSWLVVADNVWAKDKIITTDKSGCRVIQAANIEFSISGKKILVPIYRGQGVTVQADDIREEGITSPIIDQCIFFNQKNGNVEFEKLLAFYSNALSFDSKNSDYFYVEGSTVLTGYQLNLNGVPGCLHIVLPKTLSKSRNSRKAHDLRFDNLKGQVSYGIIVGQPCPVD